jgi:hypothetical protein
MSSHSMLTVRGETKTVKGDNQTIHLMAKVDNQNPSTDPPSEPQQQPNQPQTASIGFNTSILANQISNLTGLIYNYMPEITSMLGSMNGGAGISGMNISPIQQQRTVPQSRQQPQPPQVPQFQPRPQQPQQQQPL